MILTRNWLPIGGINLVASWYFNFFFDRRRLNSKFVLMEESDPETIQDFLDTVKEFNTTVSLLMIYFFHISFISFHRYLMS